MLLSFFNALAIAIEFEVLSVDCEALFDCETIAPPLSASTVFVADLAPNFRTRLFHSSFLDGI
jgi:hypothetical protein